MPLAPASVVDRVSAAISTAALRHEVIAANISNRDAQGYQRMKLAFEDALGGHASPVVVPDTAPAGASLEQDLLDLSANAMRYESMTRMLGRYFSILGAIAGNRG